jgi:hypothetical protein
VSDSEIKVGVLAPLSGYAAFLGQEEFDGVKAYLEDVNAKGGVQGKKYRVIAADTRWEPATEAIGARRLIEQEKVFAIFTTWSDSIGSYVASKGIPDFAFGIAPPAFASKWPSVYPIGFNTVDQILNMAYVQTQVLKKPIKSVAIVYETANIPWGAYVEEAKHAWEQFGVQVKSMDRFNLSDGDCTQLVLKVQGENVDFWQVGNSLGWPLCQQAMTRQNYTPPQGRGGPYTDDILWGNQMAQGYEGVYAQTNGVQLGLSSPAANKGQPYPYVKSGIAPEVDHYIDSMRKYSPRSATDALLEGIWTQSFWSQAKLLDDGIKAQNGSITWKGVNQWIQSQTRWDSGLVGIGNFTPSCKTGVSNTWLYQYHWNAAKNTVEEGDWHAFGGPHPTPEQYALLPGKGSSEAGLCYMGALSDSKM